MLILWALVGIDYRLVHHLDVASLLMVQNVVEARERPEDEQDVAGTEADELGAGSDTRVVAPRRRPETGRDPRDVRAVADRGLTVREVLDEQVRCLRGLVDRALEREEICEVEKN